MKREQMNIFGRLRRKVRHEERFVTDAIRARLLLRGIDPDNLKPRRFESPTLFARIISMFRRAR